MQCTHRVDEERGIVYGTSSESSAGSGDESVTVLPRALALTADVHEQSSHEHPNVHVSPVMEIHHVDSERSPDQESPQPVRNAGGSLLNVPNEVGQKRSRSVRTLESTSGSEAAPLKRPKQMRVISSSPPLPSADSGDAGSVEEMASEHESLIKLSFQFAGSTPDSQHDRIVAGKDVLFQVVVVDTDQDNVFKAIVTSWLRDKPVLQNQKSFSKRVSDLRDSLYKAIHDGGMEQADLREIGRRSSQYWSAVSWQLQTASSDHTRKYGPDFHVPLNPLELEVMAKLMGKDMVIWERGRQDPPTIHAYAHTVSSSYDDVIFLYKGGAYYHALYDIDPDDNNVQASMSEYIESLADASQHSAVEATVKRSAASSSDDSGSQGASSDVRSSTLAKTQDLNVIDAAQFTPRQLYDLVVPEIMSEEFVAFMGDPEDASSLWGVAAEVVSSRPHLDFDTVVPFLAALKSYGVKRVVKDPSVFWLDGRRSFITGVLTLCLAYPGLSSGQKASEQDKKGKAPVKDNLLGVYVPAINAVTLEIWNDVYAWAQRPENRRRYGDVPPNPDSNLLQTWRNSLRDIATTDSRDGFIVQKGHLKALYDVACAIAVRSVQEREPDRIIPIGAGRWLQTFLANGNHRHAAAVDKVKAILKQSPDFHVWCVSDQERSQLHINESIPDEKFAGLTGSSEMRNWRQNVWGKGLREQIMDQARRELDHESLQPFYRASATALPHDWEEQGAAVIRVMEFYRRSVERASLMGPNSGSDYLIDKMETLHKHWSSQTKNLNIEFKARAFLAENPLINIRFRDGVQTLGEGANEREAVADNLPMPDGRREALQGVKPRPLVYSDKALKRNVSEVKVALAQDLAHLMALHSRDVECLANGMASFIKGSRDSLFNEMSGKSLIEVYAAAHEAQESAEARRAALASTTFNKTLTAVTLKSFGRLLAALAIELQHSVADEKEVWAEALVEIERRTLRILSIASLRAYSSKYFLYAPVFMMELEASTRAVRGFYSKLEDGKALRQGMFLFRQLSEALLHCTGHAARTPIIPLTRANQLNWIEGFLNWEFALSIDVRRDLTATPHAQSNRLTCPFHCSVPLVLPESSTTAFRDKHDIRLSVCVDLRRGAKRLWPLVSLGADGQTHPCLVNVINRCRYHPMGLVELTSFAQLSHLTCKAGRGKYDLVAEAESAKGTSERPLSKSFRKKNKGKSRA